MTFNRDEIRAMLAWAEKEGLAIPPSKKTAETLTPQELTTINELLIPDDEDLDVESPGTYHLSCSYYNDGSFWTPPKHQNADLDPEERVMEYWSDCFQGNGTTDGCMPSSRM